MAKKTLYLWIVLCAMCLVLMGVVQSADAQMLGRWPLDEGTGAVVADVSGNGNDGTFGGSPEWVDDPDRGLFTEHFRKVSGGMQPPEGMDAPGAERVMVFLTPEQVSSPVMYSGKFDDFEDNFSTEK